MGLCEDDDHGGYLGKDVSVAGTPGMQGTRVALRGELVTLPVGVYYYISVSTLHALSVR